MSDYLHIFSHFKPLSKHKLYCYLRLRCMKKENKVTGWLHLATWVFLLILILCITMVNFLKFLWQIFDEVFDKFFWQKCRNRKSCSFLAINLFISSAPGQDLTHFVSNGTKLNIPLQTKPPINDAMIINVSEKKKLPEK